MAKLLDKMFNRVIEGELLEITEEEKTKLGLGGGTQLYLHEGTIQGDSEETYNYKIISYQSTIFANVAQLIENSIDCKVLNNEFGDGEYITAFFNYSVESNALVILNPVTATLVKLDVMLHSVQDEVTPL